MAPILYLTMWVVIVSDMTHPTYQDTKQTEYLQAIQQYTITIDLDAKFILAKFSILLYFCPLKISTKFPPSYPLSFSTSTQQRPPLDHVP